MGIEEWCFPKLGFFSLSHGRPASHHCMMKLGGGHLNFWGDVSSQGRMLGAGSGSGHLTGLGQMG